MNLVLWLFLTCFTIVYVCVCVGVLVICVLIFTVCCIVYTVFFVLFRSYRVSQEECARLRESVPYVKVYRYNPKHLYPKLNGYGDNGQRSLKL